MQLPPNSMTRFHPQTLHTHTYVRGGAFLVHCLMFASYEQEEHDLPIHFCFPLKYARRRRLMSDDSLRLGDNGGGGGGLVSPGRGEYTDGLVVAGETVDTGLNENQAELGVLVLAVALEVLADGNGLWFARQVNQPVSSRHSTANSSPAFQA